MRLMMMMMMMIDGRLFTLHAGTNLLGRSNNTIKELVEAAPDYVLRLNNAGEIPLQFLCAARDIDEKVAIENF